MRSISTLLAGLVDYAGLFPPATLDMAAAVRDYDLYRRGPDAPTLGRFIVPVARLAEMETAVRDRFPRGGDRDPWRLSALAGAEVAADAERIARFNERHALNATGDAAGDPGAAVIDAVELKASRAADVERAARELPAGVDIYVEIPIAADPRELIAAIADAGVRGKVRTGGVTPDLFPDPEHLARFLRVCADANVPFKATAGLHHPVRAEYPLSYEEGCERGTMYGFLNVFVAAAFVYDGMHAGDAERVLGERSPEAFRFDDDGVSWRGERVGVERLAQVRRKFAISFGSCSFREPVDEMRSLYAAAAQGVSGALAS
ncbi:MAG: hypothetical protein WKG32_12460 [Gemmatimonadaceae bacterium]